MITQQDIDLNGRLTNRGWMSTEQLLLMYHKLKNMTKEEFYYEYCIKCSAYLNSDCGGAINGSNTTNCKHYMNILPN